MLDLDSLQQSTFHLYQNIEFHINQQRVHVPLTMESIQVTDLGTNVRIAAMGTSLFSMRGNFTHVPNIRNNHVILRFVFIVEISINSNEKIIDLYFLSLFKLKYFPRTSENFNSKDFYSSTF